MTAAAEPRRAKPASTRTTRSFSCSSCNPPNADGERPRDCSCPARWSPMLSDLLQHRSDRVEPALTHERRDRGPASQILAQLTERPLQAQLNDWRGNLRKREWYRPVA